MSGQLSEISRSIGARAKAMSVNSMQRLMSIAEKTNESTKNYIKIITIGIAILVITTIIPPVLNYLLWPGKMINQLIFRQNMGYIGKILRWRPSNVMFELTTSIVVYGVVGLTVYEKHIKTAEIYKTLCDTIKEMTNMIYN